MLASLLAVLKVPSILEKEIFMRLSSKPMMSSITRDWLKMRVR